MTRATLAADIAWLSSNPGLGVDLFDLLNHRPSSAAQPPTVGVPPLTTWWWDPDRPGWRLHVPGPVPNGTPPRTRRGRARPTT